MSSYGQRTVASLTIPLAAVTVQPPITRLLVRCAMGLLPIACSSSAPPSEPIAPAPAQAAPIAPCAGLPATRDGSAPKSAPLPALVRAPTTLQAPAGPVDLAAGASVTLHQVATPAQGGGPQACITFGTSSGFVPRSSVAVLPFQALIRSKTPGVAGKPVVVEGSEGEKLLVNLSGLGSPEPTVTPWRTDAVDLSPTASPVLLGDLSLDAWQPLSGEAGAGVGELDEALSLRGLGLPAGSVLRWAEGGRIAELELTSDASVGGRELRAGTRLVLAQGCDVVLVPVGGAEECLAVKDGRLAAP